MKKLAMSAAALLLAAGAIVGLGTSAQATNGAGIKIPGTNIVAPDSQEWNDSGAAYTINHGYQVVTRFYGMRHCYFNNVFDASHGDSNMCYSILQGSQPKPQVVVFKADGSVVWTSVQDDAS